MFSYPLFFAYVPNYAEIYTSVHVFAEINMLIYWSGSNCNAEEISHNAISQSSDQTLIKKLKSQ